MFVPLFLSTNGCFFVQAIKKVLNLNVIIKINNRPHEKQYSKIITGIWSTCTG